MGGSQPLSLRIEKPNVWIEGNVIKLSNQIDALSTSANILYSSHHIFRERKQIFHAVVAADLPLI